MGRAVGRSRRASAVLVVLAAVLAWAVVVAGPARQAAAFEVGGSVIKPIASAAIVAGEAAPTAGRLVTLSNPWGLAINAALLGLSLYQTRDTWLPWVTGTFGQDGDTGSQATTVPATGCIVSAYFTVLPSVSNGAVNPVIRSQTAGCGGGVALNYTRTLGCKNLATGDIVEQTGTVLSSSLSSGNNFTSDAAQGACGSAYSPTYYYSTLNNVNPGTVVRWSAPATGSSHEITTTVRCVHSSGETANVSMTSLAGSGLPVPSCEARLGPDWHGDQLTSTIGRPTETKRELFKAAPDSVTYANCVGPGKACTLRLLYNGQPCTTSIDECTTWATRYPTHPSEYQCKWGGYTLPISDCGVLENAYATPAVPITDPANADGDPGTGTQPTPSPTGSSSPSPSASGGTGPLLGDPPAETQPPPEATPGENDACWPSGWGLLNPASWVLRPVKCALRWAFVPSIGGVQGPIDGMRADLAATTPGLWVGALGDLAGEFNRSEAGCDGPGLTWQGVTMHPFSACDPPMSTVAGVCKTLMAAAMAVFGGLACIRAVGSGFSWTPGVGE